MFSGRHIISLYSALLALLAALAPSAALACSPTEVPPREWLAEQIELGPAELPQGIMVRTIGSSAIEIENRTGGPLALQRGNGGRYTIDQITYRIGADTEQGSALAIFAPEITPLPRWFPATPQPPATEAPAPQRGTLTLIHNEQPYVIPFTITYSLLPVLPTQTPTPAPTPVNLVPLATTILHGKVLRMDGDVAMVQVSSYLKGSGPGEVKIDGWWDTGCGPSLTPGTEGIFYTTGDPEQLLETVALRWSPHSPSLMTEISAQTGQQATPPKDVHAAAPAPEEPARSALLIVVGALTIISVVAVLIAGYARRGRRG